MKLVLDTNVLVYAFVSPEFVPNAREKEWMELHKKASMLYEDILAQKHTLIIPSVVLVELCSTISGMTRDKDKAKRAGDNVKSVAWVVYGDPLFTEQAISQGIKLKLSGFDVTIATCAIMNSANLITNDRKFYEKFSSKAEEYGIQAFLLRKMNEEEIRQLR